MQRLRAKIEAISSYVFIQLHHYIGTLI